ncbi:MAG: cation-translocating P-type ATPase [Myxococcota bacterium]
MKTPWAMAPEEVIRNLGARRQAGLSSEEARRRLAVFGANVLRQRRPKSVWSILVDQLRSLLVLLLLAAVGAALLFGEWLEAIAIFGVVVINTLIGLTTELRAVRSMEALRALGRTHANVQRDGRVTTISAEDLVPGDIVRIEGGDVVSADLRLLAASKLEADESTLTGESIPTAKSTDPVPADAELADRRSMLFKGTVVTRGAGDGVVVATGLRSELGAIAQMVEAASEERTPLEKHLDRLGRGLVWVTLGIAALVGISAYFAGKPLFLVVETSIALAVATIPEGLPAIATITLARGMRRMAQRHAVMNRLAAVETLGATSVICTDKTGTLTQNRIEVKEVEPTGDPAHRRRCLEIGALCNNAELPVDDGPATGDPLEVALLVAASREGIRRAALLREQPEVREIAFDAESRMMATVHGDSPPYRVAVKGAPEAVLDAARIEPDDRAAWTRAAERMAENGLRILAVAERFVDDPHQPLLVDLTFLGMIGMYDPPRPEVRRTVQALRRASVQLVMVTGDHPATARSIARAVGLSEEPEVRVGRDLEPGAGSSREGLRHSSVFARVSPRQKLELIALHQRAGAVVAMTGDGVNDAPALKKADIGVAMGARGTPAAKEAADMVLKNDDFSTLVVAIAEGRAIFDNIRTFAVYLLSCNLTEVLVVSIAALVGAPLPLLPLQILFLNLLTDVFPALALGVSEGGAQVMTRPPRDPSEPILARRHWKRIVGYSVVMTVVVLGAFAIAIFRFAQTASEAVTVSFLTLALAQLLHVFNMRERSSGMFSNEVTKNPWVWAALVLCVGLLVLATELSSLSAILNIVSPSPQLWLFVLGMSAIPVVVIQAWAALRRAPVFSVREPKA